MNQDPKNYQRGGRSYDNSQILKYSNCIAVTDSKIDLIRRER